MFYSRFLTEVFIDFGSMCLIAQIGKNHVNRQRWHSITVQFSNKKWMVYKIKCFGKQRTVMIRENTSTVKTISKNIFRHVNNYILEKHGSKEKTVIVNDFQSIFKK